MKSLVVESEPANMRNLRLELEGRLLKRTTCNFKQERIFRLYKDGQIRYFKGDKQIGTWYLDPGQTSVKDGRQSFSMKVRS